MRDFFQEFNKDQSKADALCFWIFGIFGVGVFGVMVRYLVSGIANNDSNDLQMGVIALLIAILFLSMAVGYYLRMWGFLPTKDQIYGSFEDYPDEQPEAPVTVPVAAPEPATPTRTVTVTTLAIRPKQPGLKKVRITNRAYWEGVDGMLVSVIEKGLISRKELVSDGWNQTQVEECRPELQTCGILVGGRTGKAPTLAHQLVKIRMEQGPEAAVKEGWNWINKFYERDIRGALVELQKQDQLTMRAKGRVLAGGGDEADPSPTEDDDTF